MYLKGKKAVLEYIKDVLYYFVVVDAGSSGSRLRLYSGMKSTDDLLFSLKEEYTMSASPGLQDVSEEQLSPYLNKLFFGLNTTLENLGLDESAQQSIPVRFYATAGMREVSPMRQNITYHTVTEWIATNTYFTDIEAKTIPGEYEALYNWLAVNYLNNAFLNGDQPAAVFDLGGGSSEIAYETMATSGPSLFELVIANRTYHVTSETWLGTGQDWARDQYLDHAGCFPLDYPMPDLGYYPGNFQDCQYSVNSPFVTHSSLHPMKLSSSFIPQNVHLIASFYYLYEALVYKNNAMPASVIFNISAFHDGAEQYCSTPWNTITGQSPYQYDEYANTYCFGGALTDSIYKNMHLAELSANYNLSVTKKINSTTVSWSIGVVDQLITGTQFVKLPNSSPTAAPTMNPSKSAELSSALIVGICIAGGIFVVAISLYLAARNSKNVAGFLKDCGNSISFWKHSNASNQPLSQMVADVESGNSSAPYSNFATEP